MNWRTWFFITHKRCIRYPARIEKIAAGYIVTFPDFPQLRFQAETLGWARSKATDALLDGIQDCFLEGRRPPRPSPPEEGDEIICLSEGVSRKVRLVNNTIGGWKGLVS